MATAALLCRKTPKPSKTTTITTKTNKPLPLSELKALGTSLLSSRAHINNLTILLLYIITKKKPEYVIEAILCVQSFFVPIVGTLTSSSKASSGGGGGVGSVSVSDPEVVYERWVRGKFDEFIKSLLGIVGDENVDEIVRDVAVDAVMEFVKLGKGGKFETAIYHKFLSTVVNSNLADDALLDSVVSKFFKYIDVRYFTYITLEKLATSFESVNVDDASQTRNVAIHKIQYLLLHVPPLGTEESKSGCEMWSDLGFSSMDVDGPEGKPKKEKTVSNGILSAFQIAKIKSKFSKAWMTFLRLPLPLDVYKEVLANLDEVVIPHISKPKMLSDFLTRSYDKGGVVSVMALSGLFILMTQHALEYAKFYEKLYGLLEPSIFMAKHRSKFFKLLDQCLKSRSLGEKLAASFTKKLSRLALVVPPAGALVIIALIHNLLRRHPNINYLVHKVADNQRNEDAAASRNNKQSVDPFNYDESDPEKSNVEGSSLWEIQTLRHHYCPAVSRIVLSLENDLTIRAKTAEIDVGDFKSGSYATIFREETERRMKQVAFAIYPTAATPTSLFSDSDFPGWTFPKKEECSNNENVVTAISREDDNKPAKKQRV